MSYETRSATEPSKVQVEARAGGMAADVWLRKDISQDTADMGEGGKAVTYWAATELHYVAAGVPTAEEVEASFDELWAAHEDDGLSDAERMARLASRIEDNAAALIELGDLIGGE